MFYSLLSGSGAGKPTLKSLPLERVGTPLETVQFVLPLLYFDRFVTGKLLILLWQMDYASHGRLLFKAFFGNVFLKVKKSASYDRI